MISLFGDGVRLEEMDGTFYYSFDYANKSILRVYVLNPQGKVERRHWDYGNKEWELKGTFQVSDCDVYGICGPFGICNSQSSPICTCLRGFEPKNKDEWNRQNWTSGCVRREALECDRVENGSKEGKPDGFLKLEMAKVPHFAGWSPSKDGSPSDGGDCRTQCLSNCSCIAFAYDAGVGCMFWSSDLLDIQKFSNGGVDLFIRLSYSELDEDRNTKTIIIIVTVLPGAILIIISVYILWRRIAKQAGGTERQIHNENRIDELKRIRIQDLTLFDFGKLATATNNFHSENKLGQGGFGPVYKEENSGYIAPEYAMQGIVCEQSDVFSFGVLLLEIVSGRRNTCIYEDAESLSLVGFAWKSWNNNNITSLIDPQIYDPSLYKDVLRCVHIGLLCVQELVRNRPIMATVISMLHSEIVDIPVPRKPAFIHSQTLSDTLMPTHKNDAMLSVNNVSLTDFEGR
ncbi:hypothetical protein RJT34_15481 [Clitoria ternatea]|uniref:Apple domain-containing protein n=1 Tax=Clitoria ternatea TaxID=43366 RepID=A0AAN9J5I4_CLITE